MVFNATARVPQLLAVLHEIGKNLDQNVQTDVLYLDFAKAFDTVDHQILLKKRFGVVDRMHDWFKDYLHQRFQGVVVDGAVSDWDMLLRAFRKEVFWVLCYL
jgi:hypothetical protein